MVEVFEAFKRDDENGANHRPAGIVHSLRNYLSKAVKGECVCIWKRYLAVSE